jgi:hypothetical protein
MKKLLLVLVVPIFCLKVDAQYVTISDANFLTWLNNNGYSNCLSGNQLDTTCPAVTNATHLYPTYYSISDLNGLQYFDNLDTLYCQENQIVTLPTLPHTLKFLKCDDNLITSLPSILPDAMTDLYCNFNGISTLPPLPAGLSTLECSYNQLSNLPPLPNSLKHLYCGYNQLVALPALPENLIYLHCGFNELTTLPAFSNTLKYLNCHSNQLTALPDLPDTLLMLFCNGNPDLTCLPPLAVYASASTSAFNIFGTAIHCLPNSIQHPNVAYVPAIDTMPLCSNFNPNGCPTNCQSNSTQQSISICQGDTIDLNNQLLYLSGIYYDTLTSMAGCDSVVITELTVTELNISISASANILTATGGIEYQWYNCDNNQPISGATNPIYEAIQNGNYAALVTDANGCTEMSDCVNVTGIGINEINSYQVVIVPNPASQSVTIQLSQPTSQSKIVITDIIGRNIISQSANNSSTTISLADVADGSYFVQLLVDDKIVATKKLVVIK